jgi:hypothetical protein
MKKGILRVIPPLLPDMIAHSTVGFDGNGDLLLVEQPLDAFIT